ncbi:hypothetical protein J421_5295 (plasmid) [Gemmatirosa kalamazoonensis]|uniref:Uncharacterized protein n=1 Tax=Gemmatirosa kalamazoonensis TaxID=861299 RepID=W0RR88_9BACT|nr:hypothetical protein [Gemmatirosa kalamazoonensis]AHG92830.1 hypothetical protein J421_5295 [Gemmatirosa kalamazoonensis]
MDRPLDRLARAGTNPEIVRQVAVLLAERWDPGAELAAPDGTCEPAAHAGAVLGVLGGGGPLADVVGYLRRAEEDRFVFPRSTAAERWALAEAIHALVLGTATPDSPAA